MSSFGRASPVPKSREAYLVWAKTRAHRERVERGREALLRAAQIGPLAVSSSWGKDSTALCDLAVETLDKVPIVHLASSYRMPGWEPVAAHFAGRTEVIDLEPTRDLAGMLEWLREVGLGYERTTASGKRAGGAQKKDRITEYLDQRGIQVSVLGMRAEESGVRKGLLLGRGTVYTRRSDGATVCCPLAWWTAQDVWAYIFSRGLPYHRLYDLETHGQTRETLRNTGWLTTLGVENGRIAWLRRHFPEQYRLLLDEFPQLRLHG